MTPIPSVCTGPITATVSFNQQGVVGSIVFTELDNGSIQIDTSFLPGNFSSWHVHLFPVDFTADPATRCNPRLYLGPHLDPSDRLGAAGENYSTVCNPGDPLRCEAGDLSGKFGPLTAGNFTYVDTDPEFQLEGRYSIVGRSVIIHPPGGGHLACGNVYLNGDEAPDIYAATFLGPTVAGAIYFRRSDFEPDIGVFIYANLYYTDGSDSNTMNHRWGIYTDKVVSETKNTLCTVTLLPIPCSCGLTCRVCIMTLTLTCMGRVLL